MALSYSAYAVATLVADQFNYLLSNMLLYQMNSIKCSSVLPPSEIVVLQMLNVAVGPQLLSN